MRFGFRRCGSWRAASRSRRRSHGAASRCRSGRPLAGLFGAPRLPARASCRSPPATSRSARPREGGPAAADSTWRTSRGATGAASQAGHSPTMTLSTYAHLFEELVGTERRSAEEEIRRARDASRSSRTRFAPKSGSGRPGPEEKALQVLRADARTRTEDPFITSVDRVSRQVAPGRNRHSRSSGVRTRPPGESTLAHASSPHVRSAGSPRRAIPRGGQQPPLRCRDSSGIGRASHPGPSTRVPQD